MNSDQHPSATIEDYLQAIYSLDTEGERAHSTRLARWMKVATPTAWGAVQRMRRDGLVEVDAKKNVRLTERGRELAENVARRHRLSERFLTDILGLGWAEAHVEAHQFEHGVTPIIERRIDDLLGRPTTCPHGSPIPGSGATLSPALVPLENLAAGEDAIIEFISEELEEDRETLEYLDRNDLKPGRKVTAKEKLPAVGLIVLETERGDVSLGLTAAGRIRVRRAAS